MNKRITWRNGAVVKIHLRPNLFVIGQMLISPRIRIYNVFDDKGIWGLIDLNAEKILCTVMITQAVVKELIVEKITSGIISSKSIDQHSYWIKPYTLTMDGKHYPGSKGDFPFLGGRVIDLGVEEGVSTTTAATIQEDLVLPKDRGLIEDLELTNMWGAEALHDRLCRFYDTGVNRDDLKYEVFPGLWEDRKEMSPLSRRLPVPMR